MSTSYLIEGKTIDFEALKTEGKKVEMVATKHKQNTEGKQCYALPDGNCVWAYRSADGSTTFTCWGTNDVVETLCELADCLGGTLVSEHEDAFFDEDLEAEILTEIP